MRGPLICLTILALTGLPAPGVEPPTEAKPPKETAAVAKANNDFAFDLYRDLAGKAKPGDNLWFSPYSVRAALAMTYAGARGKTAAEMAKALRFDADQGKFHPTFAGLTRSLRTPAKGFAGDFNVANSVWTDRGFPLLDSYKAAVARDYEAGLFAADFRGDADTERKRINAWVGGQTKGLIPDLLPAGAVDADTRLTLVNAIYFKALWDRPFDKKLTQPAKFRLSPLESVEVPMMSLRAGLRHFKDDAVEMVELPYAGKQYSMVLLLPAEGKSLPELEGRLGEWDAWCGGLAEVPNLQVRLPRHELRVKAELAKTLQALGMVDPFAPGADFSGMSKSRLWIGGVIHEAVIKTDEEGSEAAAATAVVMRGGAPPKATVFSFDRPGLLAVRDMKTGTILFLGRISNPAAK